MESLVSALSLEIRYVCESIIRIILWRNLAITSATNEPTIFFLSFYISFSLPPLFAKCPPLGAALLEDAGSKGLAWFQNAEIKHGRSAMLATIGFMVQKWGVHFPLYLGPYAGNAFHSSTADPGWMLSPSQGISFADIGAAAPLDAIKMVPTAGWLQIFFVMGWWECVNYHRQYNQGGRVPGEYGYDPLGFTKGKDMDSEEVSFVYQTREASESSTSISNEVVCGSRFEMIRADSELINQSILAP